MGRSVHIWREAEPSWRFLTANHPFGESPSRTQLSGSLHSDCARRCATAARDEAPGRASRVLRQLETGVVGAGIDGMRGDGARDVHGCCVDVHWMGRLGR
jgi:hypothetical protein